MAWLQLVRWRNLLIIFITQLLAWWCVILPSHPQALNPENFFCLSASTVLIAAAGYIINDYFDIKIDAINRPDKVILGRAIPRKQAIVAHTALNIAALALAANAAIRAHHYAWPLLQVLCSVLLWFYSTDFKRQYVTGNLVIGALTALTIVALTIYEPGLPLFARWVLLVYAYFAFLLTWMREIVKDMEDYIGDEVEGCETMPIKKGLDYSSRFCIYLSLFALVPLAIASALLFYFAEVWLAAYIVAALIAPLAAWSFFLARQTTTRHYHQASRGLKIIMLLGVCSLLIYHFQLFADRA